MINVCFLFSANTEVETSYDLYDYYQVISDYNKESDLDIAYVKQVDLNQDGLDEIIIGLGKMDTFLDEFLYEKLFVLSAGDLSLINNGEFHWFIEQIQVIKLEGSEDDFLYLKTTNGINRSGISILTIENDSIVDYDIPPSAYGSGISTLEDEDENNHYDTIHVLQWSYSSLYYEIQDTFRLSEGSFMHVNRDIELGNYPNDVRDLIHDYIGLTILSEYDSDAIKSRLNDITQNITYDISRIQRSDIMHALIALEDEAFSYEENMEGTTGIIDIRSPKNATYIYHYTFSVEKIDNKWYITNIVDQC